MSEAFPNLIEVNPLSGVTNEGSYSKLFRYVDLNNAENYFKVAIMLSNVLPNCNW